MSDKGSSPRDGASGGSARSRSKSASRSPRQEDKAEVNSAGGSGGSAGERSPPREAAASARRSSHSRSRSPPPAGAGKEPARSVDPSVANPGNNLYVANLVHRLGEAELQELFSKYGRVDKCEVILDPVTHESRGFGFVTFEDIRDAEDAVKSLNGTDVEGRTIKVEHAKRKRGHEKTPGKYLGPRLASAKYSGREVMGRDRFSRDRSRDRGPRRSRSRSRDRGGYSRRYDDRDRGRYDDRDRGRYDDRDRGRGGYDRYDDRRGRR